MKFICYPKCSTCQKAQKWLDLEMTEDEIIKTIESTIFEQYPVVDGDIDHVVGVLSIKDYVTALRKDKHLDLKKMMKEAHYVHENMSIYTVLEYMKSERIHRALVCDEFGGLEGIISLKEIFVGIEIKDTAGIAPQRHRLLLLVANLAPGLDDILLGVGHVVQSHLVGILVVGKAYDSLCSALHRFLLAALII